MNALLMAAAMTVAPAQAAPAEALPTHEVLRGESLSLIAQCEMGDAGRWVELLALNEAQITNPDIIEPGWTLVLPAGASGECPTEPVVAAASSAPSPEVPVQAAPANAAATTQAPEPAHRHTPAPQGQASQTSSGSGLAGIRACESGGDYGAVSANGQYRGAYQFDQGTWESVGGSGDPANASAAEQDRRAAALQQQRGSSPWPRCG
ncbi:MAG TPA: transglycosylase family protein [Acidimicrobiales bacterium]|nr:transglycosylase family protein [Acidimicrobiales bacterium]